MVYWMLIFCFEFILCYLSKGHPQDDGYNLRCSKESELPTKDSLLLIEGEYIYDILLGSLLENF